MAAGADARPLRPVHQDGGVPPDVRADAPLDVLVAGEPGLALGRDRVDVVGGGQRRHADLPLPGPFEQPQHHVPGALPAALVDHAVERLDPLERLLGIDVRQLARQAVADHWALALAHIAILPSVRPFRHANPGRTRRSAHTRQ